MNLNSRKNTFSYEWFRAKPCFDTGIRQLGNGLFCPLQLPHHQLCFSVWRVVPDLLPLTSFVSNNDFVLAGREYWNIRRRRYLTASAWTSILESCTSCFSILKGKLYKLWFQYYLCEWLALCFVYFNNVKCYRNNL